jgi:hypothetical protein
VVVIWFSWYFCFQAYKIRMKVMTFVQLQINMESMENYTEGEIKVEEDSNCQSSSIQQEEIKVQTDASDQSSSSACALKVKIKIEEDPKDPSSEDEVR